MIILYLLLAILAINIIGVFIVASGIVGTLLILAFAEWLAKKHQK